jgi:hypothetical protein
MTTLTGKKIANTYKDLLQISNSNSGIDATLRNVEDGEGTSSPLQLSTDTINLGGTIQLDGETLTANASALNNIADLTGATGLVAVSAGNVFGRSIAVGSPLSVTNADGTEGNPTITMADSGVSAGDYGPMNIMTVDAFGRVTDVTATATISANAFYGGNFDGSQLDIENNASIGGDLIVSGTANIPTISASDLTVNNVSATTKIFSPIVSTTGLHAVSASIGDLKATTLSFSAVSISAQTVNQLTVVSGATLAGVSVATINDVTTLSATMATSIDNSNTNIAAVSALTSVNSAAITSINTVIDNFDFATSAELATLSATMATSINNSNTNITTNTNAITSINTVIDNLDFATSAELATLSATMATSIDNRTQAITSINTVIDNLDFATSAELATLSATMATSINNRTTAITSINTVVANVSALTSVNAAAITSINTVVDNLDFATSAELATLSATMATSINNTNTNLTNLSATMATSIGNRTSAITSINTVVANLSSTFATSINNRTAAITSINTVITDLSATLATSIGNRTSAITSINTVVANLSSTLATSISNFLPLAGGTLTGQVSGTGLTMSGNISASAFYGDGSNLTNLPTAPTSVTTFTTNQLTVVSIVNGDLTLSGSSSPTLKAIDTTNNLTAVISPGNTEAYFGTTSNHPTVFLTNNTDHGRFDTSGNFLVSKNAIGTGTVGVEARADGFLAATRDGNQPLLLDRRTSHGNLINLQKDGSTVGIVGTQGWAINNSTTTDAALNIKQTADNEYQLKLEQNNVTDGYGLICDLTDGALAFARYASSTYTERMRLTSDGKLSVATQNTPSNKNTINPSLIVNGSGVQGSAQIVRHTTPGGGGATLQLGTTRGNDVNSYTVVQDGDGIGSVIFNGADGDQFVTGVQISAVVDGTPGNDDMPGKLYLMTTADGASSATTRLAIDSAGQVGIGLTVPEAPFQVIGDASGLNDGDVALLEGNNAGGNRGIHIGQEGSGTQARLFLQGYHSQSVTNYWDILMNPYGGVTHFGYDGQASYGNSAPVRIVKSNSGGLGVGMTIVNPNAASGTSAALELAPNTNIALSRIEASRQDAAGDTDVIMYTYDGGLSEHTRLQHDFNLGVNFSNPQSINTNGHALAIKGGTNNSVPAVLTLQGGTTTGQAFYQKECFGVSGITGATEISRISLTGRNGFRLWGKVRVFGHTGSLGDGHDQKEFYWDGNTSVTTYNAFNSGSNIPSVTFTASANTLIINLQSGNASNSFSGCMVIEWMMPIDFAGNTGVVS